MTYQEYTELKTRLLNKRHDGNITAKEAGYNTGIECAVSMIREVYCRQFPKEKKGKKGRRSFNAM